MPPAFYLSFCKKKKENTLFFVWPKSLENIEKKKFQKKREREFTCLNHRQNFCFRLKRLASNGAHTKEFSFISLNFFLFVNFSIYVGCEERPWLLISHNKWSQHNWEFCFVFLLHLLHLLFINFLALQETTGLSSSKFIGLLHFSIECIRIAKENSEKSAVWVQDRQRLFLYSNFLSFL